MEIIFLSGLYAGPFIISVLVYSALRKNPNNIFLASSAAFLWYSLLMNYLFYTRDVLNYPYLIRTGHIAGYLIVPSLYLFVRNTFYPGRLWKKSDWFLLIPAIIYVIDMFPLFIMPLSEKVDLFREILSDPKRRNMMSEGLLRIPYFHLAFRYIYSFLVMVLVVRLVILNRDNQPVSTSAKYSVPYNFILTLVFLYIPAMVPGIVASIFFSSSFTAFLVAITLVITLIGILLYMLFTPEVLYGYTRLLPQVSDNKATNSGFLVPDRPIMRMANSADKLIGEITRVKILRPSGLPETQTVVELIEKIFKEKKLFRQPGYSIHDLSKDISIPVYQLSVIINNYYNSNFNNWINKYRIQQFLILAEMEENKNLTYEALARMAGFNNRVSFSNAFKKEKGITPGQYLKQKKRA